MAYSRTTWENSPSTATPISAALLNNIEQGIVDVDGSISSISGSVTSIAGSVTTISGSVNNTAGSVATIAGTAGTAYNLTSTYGSVSSHVSATTSVHGITDTANLVYTNNATLGSVATINASLGSVAGTVTNLSGSVSNIAGTAGTAVNLTATQGSVAALTPGTYSPIVTSRVASLSDTAWNTGKVKFFNSTSYYCITFPGNAVGAYLGYTTDDGLSFSFPGGTVSSPFWGGSSTLLGNSNIILLDTSSNGSVIYIAADTNPATYPIYKSTNGGATFSTVGATLARYRNITCSANGSVVYAISQASSGTMSLAYSADGGTTWGTPAAIASASGVHMAPVNGGNGSVAYVNVGGTLYRTLNAGNTWATLTLPGTGLKISNVSANASGSVVVISGLRESTQSLSYLYKSTDQGSTWSAIGSKDQWLSVAISPDGNKIIAEGSRAVYVSTDGGASFKIDPRILLVNISYYSADETRFAPDNSFIYNNESKYTF